jgi:uncharacterized protein
MTEPTPPFPFSRETTIRIDEQGVFWHDGQKVTHPGLATSFARWIDVDPETGRYILKNSINWAFITVEDAPLVVRSVSTGADGGILVALSDATTEPLDTGTLRLEPGDVPYCDVRGGRLPARFLPQAAFALLEKLRFDGDRAFLGDEEVRRVGRGEGARRA